MLLDVKPVVYLCDAIVDVVDSEMYLGNKLYNNIYKTQIDELVCDFERRSNHIIHTFSMCDSFTLKHIFSTYCESFYGCELFNLTKPYNLCPNCIFHGGKLYAIFFDCLLELIIILCLYNGMYGSSVLFWELALVDNKSVFLITCSTMSHNLFISLGPT